MNNVNDFFFGFTVDIFFTFGFTFYAQYIVSVVEVSSITLLASLSYLTIKKPREKSAGNEYLIRRLDNALKTIKITNNDRESVERTLCSRKVAILCAAVQESVLTPSAAAAAVVKIRFPASFPFPPHLGLRKTGTRWHTIRRHGGSVVWAVRL